MIQFPEPVFWPHWRGGLFGLDGMHPTIVGAALLARTILEEIARWEGLDYTAPDLGLAFAADSLLSGPPAQWDAVHDAWLEDSTWPGGPAGRAAARRSQTPRRRSAPRPTEVQGGLKPRWRGSARIRTARAAAAP